jgi:hypothetical protein
LLVKKGSSSQIQLNKDGKPAIESTPEVHLRARLNERGELAMTYRTSLRSLIVSSLVVFATTTSLAEDDKSTFLTRSIYLPVEFELCEHLEDAVLYQEEQAVSAMPVKRIFQFTYYPKLGRVEPVKAEIRVEGKRSNGERFTGRLAITPWAIVTANEHIELDFQKQLARMRHKLDVRYKPRTVVLRCSDTCGVGAKPEAVSADAAMTSSP